MSIRWYLPTDRPEECLRSYYTIPINKIYSKILCSIFLFSRHFKFNECALLINIELSESFFKTISVFSGNLAVAFWRLIRSSIFKIYRITFFLTVKPQVMLRYFAHNFPTTATHMQQNNVFPNMLPGLVALRSTQPV